MTTQHNDNFRTGAYLTETTLNVQTVGSSRFGRIATWEVDGQIYAQPLFVSDVKPHQGRSRDLLLVATMNNTMYAFDATADLPGEIVWKRNLGRAVPYNFMSMKWGFLGHNIRPLIGITSTPVVDRATATVYVVAKTCDVEPGKRCRRRSVQYYLHALDVLTGEPRSGSPVRIVATHRGKSAEGSAETARFDPATNLQRAGLLLANNRVYVAFASHQDTASYHGWLLAYDARSLKQVAAFCTTPAGEEGGIWQAGNGPAADLGGSIYVATGNGTFNGDDPEGGTDFGSSVIKLSPDLVVEDWFAPANYECLNALDVDLGSAGPMLIPDTDFLVTGGKEGVFYLLSRTSLGRISPAKPRRVWSLEMHADEAMAAGHAPCPDPGLGNGTAPVQSFQASPLWGFHFIAAWGYHHIHGSPVFWESAGGSLIYSWAERDFLRAFRFDRAQARFIGVAPPGDKPASSLTSAMVNNAKGMPGAALSISADGAKAGTGIVWASHPLNDDALVRTVSGILRAFDAATLRELWNSEMNRSRDEVGNFAKYCVPTIAKGRVFLATFSDRVDVYGLLGGAGGR